MFEPQRSVLKDSPPELQRLKRNVNGYRGENIDLPAVLSDSVAAARAHGWVIEEILPGSNPLLVLTRPASRDTQVEVMRGGDGESDGRKPSATRAYLSTGIHGDEPAGPLAVRQLLEENQWPVNLDLWLCPCLNPAGFQLNRRENAKGLDLNRQYREPHAEETLVHIAWLKRQPAFDLCLCLHEDWESHGFYVYELNPDNQPSLAETIVARVAEVCPIDRSEMIEDRPARDGIIRPSLDPRSRPQWPEAFFLLNHKTRLSYTLEAPSDFPLPVRVAALVAGVRAALERLVGQKQKTGN